MKEQSNRIGKGFWVVMVSVAGLAGAWAVGTVLFSLAKMNWQVSELLRSYLVATGAIGEFQTLVEFYTHIKGVEYLIVLAFLVAFPAFFKYINSSAREATPARR